MIKASEARINVINYENALYRQVAIKVNEVLETVSRSIEFHSQNGINTLEFMPYEISRFSSWHNMEIAKEVFEKILKENGYTIILNNPNDNILKITW